MIISFKIFESKISKEKNPVTWKGIPFWIGIVDKSDGEIIAVWTYEKAKSCDFHHSFYMTDYLEKIDDEEYGIFWFNDDEDIDGWDNSVTPELMGKILDQVKKR